MKDLKINKQNEYLTCYLAGAMEALEDNGLTWRLEAETKLAQYNIKCIIPQFIEQSYIKDIHELKQLAKTNYEQYKKTIRKIAYLDISVIQDADFIITHWNGEVTSGTFAEAHEAYFHTYKRNFLITTIEKHLIPGWFACCFDTEFSTLDQCIDYLVSNKII